MYKEVMFTEEENKRLTTVSSTLAKSSEALVGWKMVHQFKTIQKSSDDIDVSIHYAGKDNNVYYRSIVHVKGSEIEQYVNNKAKVSSKDFIVKHIRDEQVTAGLICRHYELTFR